MILFNKLVLTTCNQAGNAPFCDQSVTTLSEYHGLGLVDSPVTRRAIGYVFVWPWHLRPNHGGSALPWLTTKPVSALVVAVIRTPEQLRLAHLTRTRMRQATPLQVDALEMNCASTEDEHGP